MPEYWWLIAAFLSSLAGGGNVSTFILNLIITDSTEESERTSRFLWISTLCTAVSAIASLLIGFWIEYRGFLDLYWTALFVQLLTIIIVHYCMRPQSLPPVSTSSIRDIKNSKYEQLIQICTVFSPKHTYRSRKRSISLIITLIAFIFHCLASLAFVVPFLWFQLNYPFCWSGKFLPQIKHDSHPRFFLPSERNRLLQYSRFDHMVYRKFHRNEIHQLHRSQ